MSLLNNSTLANPTTSYYALAGESAKNWYQFPSLNGQIQLQDASGIEIIKSVDGNLYYNNELLAKANDIQDIADWSLYPALATVELAGQSLTQANDISSSTVHATTATISGVVEAGTLATVAGPYLPGNVKTQTVTASGQVGAGSVSASGNIQGGSLTTTGGLDMSNTGITRASSVGISNQGVAPYGSLSSPDGVMLTWNGAEVKTGASGNVAQWATFPAATNVNMASYNINTAGIIQATQGNIGTMTMTNNSIVGDTSNAVNISSGLGQSLNLNASDNATITSTAGNVTISSTTGTLSETAPSGNINRTAYNSITDEAGTSYNLTVDRLLTPLGAPINITAQNGLGGNIQITAKQSATIPPFGSTGYGEIGLSAYGSTNDTFSLGGKIDITAYSGGVPGEYGGATSRVSVGAATVALSAGAAPALPGLAGSMNMFGNGAVSIVCDLVPPVLPQIPETV